jgi:hypothetical protein
MEKKTCDAPEVACFLCSGYSLHLGTPQATVVTQLREIFAKVKSSWETDRILTGIPPTHVGRCEDTLTGICHLFQLLLNFVGPPPSSTQFVHRQILVLCTVPLQYGDVYRSQKLLMDPGGSMTKVRSQIILVFI